MRSRGGGFIISAQAAGLPIRLDAWWNGPSARKRARHPVPKGRGEVCSAFHLAGRALGRRRADLASGSLTWTGSGAWRSSVGFFADT